MKTKLFGILLMIITLTSCVSFVDATRKEPIKSDPGIRTFGNFIDDNAIETVACVNIRKAHTDLRAAHVSCVSFNGVVLLVGQVKNDEQRKLATTVAEKVKEVRQVHNELTLGGPISLPARSNDTWLTSKVKTKLLADREIPGNRIKVVTENGVVYLMGLLTNSEADRAVTVARNTAGVQKVVRVFEYIPSNQPR
ncbi:MAG: BON domain-containing protein [Pseudomonadales bacterium]|nr:BON domain-containing protein [Pseudomonadales bacterium]